MPIWRCRWHPSWWHSIDDSGVFHMMMPLVLLKGCQCRLSRDDAYCINHRLTVPPIVWWCVLYRPRDATAAHNGMMHTASFKRYHCHLLCDNAYCIVQGCHRMTHTVSSKWCHCRQARDDAYYYSRNAKAAYRAMMRYCIIQGMPLPPTMGWCYCIIQEMPVPPIVRCDDALLYHLRDFTSNCHLP